MSSSDSFPASPKSTRPIRSRAEDEDVRRVRVAVEDAVLEDHRHPRLRHQVGEPAALLQRVLVRVDVLDLRALEVLERQHARPRVGPEHLRDADVRVAGEVAMKGLGVPRLVPVVELLPDRAAELVHETARVDEVEGTYALLRDLRRLVEKLEVGLDLLGSVRPLHLHGDTAAVRERGVMDLADRRGGDRPLRELGEELLDRQAELGQDDLLDLVVRHRRDVVLQLPQLDDDVRRHDVRPGREQLAELHECRAELVEHLAQVLSAKRALAVDRADLRRPGDEIGQPVALEEVAEAVLDRDLRDFGDAPEVLRRGRARSRHRFILHSGAGRPPSVHGRRPRTRPSLSAGHKARPA